jgi:hypothetical protein
MNLLQAQQQIQLTINKPYNYHIQEAEEGIYKAIGDGLRLHPEYITTDPEATVAKQVTHENCAHINVIINHYLINYMFIVYNELL